MAKETIHDRMDKAMRDKAFRRRVFKAKKRLQRKKEEEESANIGYCSNPDCPRFQQNLTAAVCEDKGCWYVGRHYYCVGCGDLLTVGTITSSS